MRSSSRRFTRFAYRRHTDAVNIVLRASATLTVRGRADRAGPAMHRLFGRTGTRVLRALFLAALLLVPTVLRGHHAAHAGAGRPCAVCVVAQHSPALSVSTSIAGGPSSASICAVAP